MTYESHYGSWASLPSICPTGGPIKDATYQLLFLVRTLVSPTSFYIGSPHFFTSLIGDFFFFFFVLGRFLSRILLGRVCPSSEVAEENKKLKINFQK